MKFDVGRYWLFHMELANLNDSKKWLAMHLYGVSSHKILFPWKSNAS